MSFKPFLAVSFPHISVRKWDAQGRALLGRLSISNEIQIMLLGTLRAIIIGQEEWEL